MQKTGESPSFMFAVFIRSFEYSNEEDNKLQSSQYQSFSKIVFLETLVILSISREFVITHCRWNKYSIVY